MAWSWCIIRRCTTFRGQFPHQEGRVPKFLPVSFFHPITRRNLCWPLVNLSDLRQPSTESERRPLVSVAGDEMIASVAFYCPAPSFSSTTRLPRLSPSLKVVDRKAKKSPSKILERSPRETGGRRGSGVCRAELLHDAPFVVAIGACVFNSLVFPVPASESEDGEGAGGIDSTDTRFAVMGIISFIPYFNWLSWVFAWMDSGRQRYLVYSIVYLAPYFRSNLSLSPEESWLPIASIFVCILHIQLEESIRNGDVQSIKFFDEALKPFSLMIKKRDIESKRHPKEDDSKHTELPSSHGLREKLMEWDNSRKENEELEDERKDKQG